MFSPPGEAGAIVAIALAGCLEVAGWACAAKRPASAEAAAHESNNNDYYSHVNVENKARAARRRPGACFNP
jgi:hypothetical protein